MMLVVVKAARATATVVVVVVRRHAIRRTCLLIHFHADENTELPPLQFLFLAINSIYFYNLPVNFNLAKGAVGDAD